MSSILRQISYTQRQISVAKRRCLLCRVQGCMTFRMTPRYRFRHWSYALRSAILPLAQRPPQFSFFNIGSKSKIRQHPATHASIVGLLQCLLPNSRSKKLAGICEIVALLRGHPTLLGFPWHASLLLCTELFPSNVPRTKPACISAVAPSHPWRCPELDFDPRALC